MTTAPAQKFGPAIASRRLKMTVCERTDPDFSPRRRDRQCPDKRYYLVVSNWRAIDVEVNELPRNHLRVNPGRVSRCST